MANENKYTLPLGIDPAEFISGIAVIDKALGGMQTGAAEANKGMQDAFRKTVVEGEKLEATLVGNTEKAKLLRDAAKAAGKDLVDALSAKGSGRELEEKITKFQALLVKATKGGKISLDVAFDAATLSEIQKSLQQAAGEMDHFRTIVAATKTQLASLDPDSSEFAVLSEQLQATEDFMNSLSVAEGKLEGGSKSLKAQLRAMKEELALMEDQGRDGTQEFENLAIAAGKLEDQIGDTASRVRVLASDTKYIDASIQAVTGLIGAMTAAEGASALFGDENKDLQESLQKVTAAMAILQGVQAVANTLNKDSAFSILFLSRARAADAAAATVQATATTAEATAAGAATVATNSLIAALLRNPITLIVVALVAAGVAIYEFTKGSRAAREETERMTRALEDQQKVLELDISALQRRTNVLAAMAGLADNSQEEVIRIQGRGLQQQLALQQQANAMQADRINSIKGFTEEENTLRSNATQELIKGQQAEVDIINQIQLKGIELQRQRRDDAKAIREEVIKFTNDLRSTEIAGRDDQTIKQKAAAERAQVREDAAKRMVELKNQVLRSGEAEELRSKLLVAIARERDKKLRAIARDEAKALQEIQLSAAKLQLDFAKESQDRLVEQKAAELNSLNLEEQERLAMILENFKGEKRLQDSLIEGLGKYVSDKRKNIMLKYAQEETDQQEQIQLASIRLLYGFKDLPVRVEEAKQRDILRVQIFAAKKRLEALQQSGKDESDLAVIQARELISRLEGELEKATNGPKRFGSIFEVLGLTGKDGLNPKQIEAIQQGTSAIMTAYKQVTDFMLEANREQIDSSTEKINAFQKEIDTLQAGFDKEDELRKKGFANNVKFYKDELDLKKKAKDDEIKNRHDLFEKQKQIQRQQLIVDTISQGSSLVTASANVLEGFSTIPVVGPVLGAIAVAAMIAGFIASKISAFNAVNSQKETFGEGGTIDGKPHHAGGKKYIAADGSGAVRELEAGEEVTKKTQAQKYRSLLKAINEDRLEGMSDVELWRHLKGTGVHFETDIPEEGNRVANELHQASSAVFIATGGRKEGTEDLKAIREDVGYLAARKRDEVETWEDAFFTYEKRGNKTTKIRK